MAFIRKVKTASGATAVQIAYKVGVAQKRLLANQLELFPQADPLQIKTKRSFSALLWNILREQYGEMGFNQLNDEVFEALCLVRIVEPTSKLDSLRVMDDLGVDPFDRNYLYRSMVKASKLDYRKTISQACFQHIGRDGLTLVLYDVTT